MTCAEREAQTPDFLLAELPASAEAAFRAHLASCEACRQDVEGLLELWSHLGLLPDASPSPALREGFYARLEAYRAGQSDRVSVLRRLRPLWKGAAAAGLLAAGMLLGLRWRPTAPGVLPVEALSAQEAEQLRQQASMGLLVRSDPGDRLKGLALASGVKRPDASLMETLLTTLTQDPSVPVRLAAVDALYLFADAPQTRERLMAALQREESPLVQAALIDLLVALREKRAAEALKRLVGDAQRRPEVRQRAQVALQQLL